jgi:CRP/FNR family transcriptional regulator, nitrogen oxide reductase regulator
MPAKTIADFLKSGTIFAGVPVKEIASLAAVAREDRYAAREYLFTEGDAPAWFWLVRSGRVKILKQSRGGKEVVLELVAPGEPFGGVAALEGRAYPASAQAMETSTVVRIPPEPIVALARRHPGFVGELARMLGRRLRAAHDSVKSLATDPVESRLAARLMRLAKAEGERDPRGLVLPFRLTRQTLADMTGTTVETTIRVVSRWLKKGILDEGDGRLIVPSIEVLRELVEPEPE